MSWQLSKFVILKYILCYHIHLLYTLSNIWLICENKYVCHPADSCSLGCWRLFEGSTKAPCGWKEGPPKPAICFLQGICSWVSFCFPLEWKAHTTQCHRIIGVQMKKKTCFILVVKTWEYSLNHSFIHTLINSFIHPSIHSLQEYCGTPAMWYLLLC